MNHLQRGKDTAVLLTAADLDKDTAITTYMGVALVRPGSPLAQKIWNGWGRGCPTPAWGIYELDKCFVHTHELRFGDGSGMRLDKDDLADVILVPELGEKALEVLFP